MLDRLAECFYDPLVFWGVPLVLAFARLGWRRVVGWLGRCGRA